MIHNEELAMEETNITKTVMIFFYTVFFFALVLLLTGFILILTA